MKAWGNWWMACGLAALGMCVACGGGSGVTPLPEEEEGLAETVGERRVKARVDSRGGALLLKDTARVSVPRGALSKMEELSVRTANKKDLAPVPRQFELLGSPIVVTPHGLQMDRQARVLLTVDDLETPDERLGMLRLSDEEDETWSEMKGVTRVAANSAEPDDDRYRRTEAEDSLEDRRRMYAMVDTFSVFQAVRLMTGICSDKDKGEVCRPAAGGCDVAEVCDGKSVECPDDALADSGTVCAEEDTCVAEAVCSGKEAACPAGTPMPSGSACDDGLFCTTTDTCDGEGACAGSGDPCSEHLEDGDDDCSESCVEVAGDFACTGADADGTACATGITCAANECMAGSCEEVSACPIFVDAKAGEDVDGCGADWATACATVQRGSERAEEEGNPRVFVAAGEYLPAAADKAVLAMADGVSYYGSFEGTELHQDERVDLDDEADIVSSSVLSGEGLQVSIVRGASDARLDGFKIMGGGAFEGAGMYNASSSKLTVANTYFYGNSTYGTGARGAGMFNMAVDGLQVLNVTFESNSLGDGSDMRGGAMFNEGCSDLQITDSLFVANAVYGDSSAGGAIYNEKVNNLKLTHVEFLQNEVSGSVDLAGGAMVSANSSQVLEDVLFEGCKAQGSATIRGGALADVDTQSELTNVSFLGNVAAAEYGYAAEGGAYAVRGTTGTDTLLDAVHFGGNNVVGSSGVVRGGAMVVDQQSRSLDSLVRITDSRFEKNSADTYGSEEGPATLGGGLCATGGRLDLNLTGVHFDGNYVYASYDGEGRGGGLYSDARDASVAESAFLANEVSGAYGTGVAGGGAFFGAGPVHAHHLQFVDNMLYGEVGEGRSGFGAGLASQSSEMTLRDSDFIGNEAADYYGNSAGGGLGHEGGMATLVNTGFYANYATDGGGAWLDSSTSDFSVTNASFVNNYASMGPHCYVQSGTGTIRNTATLADQGDGLDYGVNTLLTKTDNCASNTSDDFEVVASGHVFLADASSCLDMGDDGVADAAFTDAAWDTLSSLADGTPDVTPVDAGRHYRADHLSIVQFVDNGQSEVGWVVQGTAATHCVLSGDGLPAYEIPEAQTASGTYTVSAAVGGLSLVCRDGGQVAKSGLGYEGQTSPGL